MNTIPVTAMTKRMLSEAEAFLLHGFDCAQPAKIILTTKLQ